MEVGPEDGGDSNSLLTARRAQGRRKANGPTLRWSKQASLFPLASLISTPAAVSFNIPQWIMQARIFPMGVIRCFMLIKDVRSCSRRSMCEWLLPPERVCQLRLDQLSCFVRASAEPIGVCAVGRSNCQFPIGIHFLGSQRRRFLRDLNPPILLRRPLPPKC